MKRIVPIILILCLLTLTGCSSEANGTPGSATPTADETPVSTPTPTIGPEPAAQQIQYTAQYIRKDSGIEGEEYPSTQLIRAWEDMNAYGASLGYDEAFFSDHALLLVRLMETSGSVTHNVASITAEGDTLTVSIVSLRPEIGTDDMAAWHILIELPADIPDDIKLDLSEVSMGHKDEIKKKDDGAMPSDKK